jgi:hypothetical protein
MNADPRNWVAVLTAVEAAARRAHVRENAAQAAAACRIPESPRRMADVQPALAIEAWLREQRT